MQKKLIFLALTGLLCLSLAGCGQSGSTRRRGAALRRRSSPRRRPLEKMGGRTPEEDGADTEAPQYTDNFSIDTEAVTAFAEQIQAAVAEKNLEALADLASYPLYIGFSDGGESVESREDLIALEADRIFSEELVSEIAGADPGAGPQQGRICPVRQRQAQCGVQCCRWQTGHCGNKLLTCSSAGDKKAAGGGRRRCRKSWSCWAGPSGIRSWTSIPPPNCWNRRRSIARPRRRRRGVYPGRRQSGRRYAVFAGRPGAPG